MPLVTAGTTVVGFAGVTTVPVETPLIPIPLGPVLRMELPGVRVVEVVPPKVVAVLPGTVVVLPTVPDGEIEVTDGVEAVVPETVLPIVGVTVEGVPTVEPVAVVPIPVVVELALPTLLPGILPNVVVEAVGAGPVPRPDPATPAKMFVLY